MLTAWRYPAMLLAVVMLCTCASEKEAASNDHAAKVHTVRQERLAELLQPDGLLSYVASGRLGDGRHAIGSARGNRIRLPDGPAHAGWVVVAGERREFHHAEGTVTPLAVGVPGGSDMTRIRLGEGFFFLVHGGGNLGWRYQVPGAAERHPFRSFDYFPVDPEWRIRAEWQPYAHPEPRAVMTSNGGVLDLVSPGEARFELGGRRYVLKPISLAPDDHRWMFLFSDRTSGRETFAGGRYLLVEPAAGDELVMDFNLAENPTCALTPHVVCPVPPIDSHLEVAVRAGERVWHPQDQADG